MTDTDPALDAIAQAADELLPQLTKRLARHGLGELEVTDGDLRLRVRGSGATPTAAADDLSASEPLVAATAPPAANPAPSNDADAPTSVPVASPAVGFFVYADGLGPGLDVGSGDAIGHVEMLGVRHEVRVPRAGVVRSLVAESGEAVEYGQVVVELEAGDGAR